MKKIICLTAITLTMSFSTSHAQICQPLNHFASHQPSSVTGIGDGCTTKTTIDGNTINADWIPNIWLYKSTFTNSCNTHDKCLVTIGSGTAECNSQFYRNMKDACDDKFHKVFRLPENQLCRTTAAMYYAAVESFQSHELTQRLQFGTMSQQLPVLRNNVENEVCGTTPELSQYFAPRVISEINNAFLTHAGRLPTIYEFLGVWLDGGNQGWNYLYNYSAWTNHLTNKAQYARNISVPAVGYRVFNDFINNPGDVRLDVNPLVASGQYLWKIPGYPNTTGTSLQISSMQPRFDQTISLQGFLRVQKNGVRNQQVIQQNITIRGHCARRPGQNVNCD
jgi:hypothetical protein